MNQYGMVLRALTAEFAIDNSRMPLRPELKIIQGTAQDLVNMGDDMYCNRVYLSALETLKIAGERGYSPDLLEQIYTLSPRIMH